MTNMSYVLNSLSLLLLAAYATTLVREKGRWEFLVASIVTTVSAFTVELRTWQVVRHTWDTGIPLVVVYASVAAAANVLLEFVVSYVTAMLVLLWILVARKEGVVLYEPDRAPFLFTRCSLYAVLRAAVAFARGHWEWLTVSRAHLAFLLIPTAETLLMFVGRDASYRYDRSPTLGTTYALLKTCVFLAVPALDEILYARVRDNLSP